MKIVFFGTPPFAEKILKYLLDHGVSVAAVVTQPDRPRGRKLQPAFSAVKEFALSQIPLILQPEKASDPSFLAQLKEIHADLFVVVAFGQILPQQLLDIPASGCINVHASLLPKYRGAAPIQRSLINGEKETGISIQKMVLRLDAGDVIANARVAITPDMTYGELENILCERAKGLLVDVIHRMTTGVVQVTPQMESEVTFAPKICAEETEIHWNQPAKDIHNLIRGLSPRPGAWCYMHNGFRRRFRIIRSTLSSLSGKPGEVIVFEKNRCIVATSLKAIELLEVQEEGKRAMTIAEWMRGSRLIDPVNFLS